MVFRHRVKYNGILYEAGQDVPMEEEVKPVAETVEEKPTVPVEETPVKRRGRRAKRD